MPRISHPDADKHEASAGGDGLRCGRDEADCGPWRGPRGANRSRRVGHQFEARHSRPPQLYELEKAVFLSGHLLSGGGIGARGAARRG